MFEIYPTAHPDTRASFVVCLLIRDMLHSADFHSSVLLCSAGCDVIDQCEGRARGLKLNYAENLSVVDSANRRVVQVFVEIQGDPNT